MKVEQQAAYILHMRPFKDSSALLDCLTLHHGLVTIVAKGAKRPRSRQFGYMQPFMALQVSWVGRQELKTLTLIEADSISPKLAGAKIVIGLYLNELLVRLLQHLDPHPQLFHDYHQTLSKLAITEDKQQQQFILRCFELKLLSALGYGVELHCDARSGETILPELLYSYDPQIGILESSGMLENQVTVSGACLMALQNPEILPSENELREAKKLMRYIFSFHLGTKPLYSRKLYGAQVEVQNESSQ